MSFNDGSGSLTTQLNNAAALVNNAAQSIINVAECDDFPDEPTQTRISRKEAREYENRIKETLPIALADGSEITAKDVLNVLDGCTEWIVGRTLRQMEKDKILASKGGKGGTEKRYFLFSSENRTIKEHENTVNTNSELESAEEEKLKNIDTHNEAFQIVLESTQKEIAHLQERLEMFKQTEKALLIKIKEFSE